MITFLSALAGVLLCFTQFSVPDARAASNPLSRQDQVSAWQNFVHDLEDFFGFGSDITKWDDVASWKLVGNRFAAGYASGGSLLALYDLSYPDLLSPVTLGEVGGPDADAQALVSVWRKAKLNESRMPDDVRSAIDAMGDLPQRVLSAGSIPRNWWKDLPWRSGEAGQSAEPREFSLADLDSARLGIGSDFASKLRDMIGVILYGADSDQSVLGSDADVLASLRFVREGQGQYRIEFAVPPETAARDSASGFTTRPRKLLDLQETKDGIFDNIKLQGLEFGLSELATMIPSPVVSALVATSISRLQRYFMMTQTEHLEMLRELLTESDEGSHADPVLGQLSDDDRGNLIRSFIWTRVPPIDFWQWLFNSPLSSWDKQRDQDSRCAAQSRQWLVDHSNWVTDLNSRFVLTTSQSPPNGALPQRELYSLADVCASGDQAPLISVDYSDPLAIAANRLALELQGVQFEFATNMIPTFGFAVMAAYNYLVQYPVDNEQYWESRLVQHLELHSLSSANSTAWDQELSILQAQRINPLEITRDRMERLIAARRQMMGL